ncbi:MAG: hypothetical protein M0R06_04640 [Sphaerochaeta sp.]|nr:hypothetical protein [Sphaerochaeta sp.]
MGYLDNIPLDVLLRARGWRVCNDGCWNWKPKSLQMMIGGTRQNVARLAYKAWVWPELGDNEQVRRVCQNRRCINPEHLARSGEARPIPEQFQKTKEARLNRGIREDYATGWYGVSDLAGMYRVPVAKVEKILRNKGEEL